MKKLLLAVVAVLMSGPAFASVSAPKDSQGDTLPTIDFVGADTCRLSSASTTAASLCVSGAGMVYGVVASSCAITNYVVMRDSATANTSSTPLATNVCEDSGADEDGTLLFKYPAPLKFSNGLSANMNATLTGAGEVIILYRKRTAAE